MNGPGMKKKLTKLRKGNQKNSISMVKGDSENYSL